MITLLPLAVFGGALLFSSLVEYTIHRALHSGYLRHTRLWAIHLAHHRANEAQTWYREGADYSIVASMFAPLGLLAPDWPCALAWILAAYSWAFYAGYMHARSHATESNFHTLHHRKPRYNYGLGSSLWDRVFRTYRRT